MGVSLSVLRPGGKARFSDQTVDVISQGEMIPKGSPVRIIAFAGREAVVEAAG
jgi:membrane-bound serine protease (ClpP class)